MCRFASRPAAPRFQEGAASASPQAQAPLQAPQALDYPFKSEDLDLDLALGNLGTFATADLDLLGNFAFEPLLPSPFGTAAAQGLPPAPLAAQSMDFQALLGVQQQQQQAAQVVVGMAAPPAFHPQYSAFLAEAQGAEAPKASRPPTGRRGKSAEEAAAQVERIKKRRRESAQRSRNRKNDYMATLEEENAALRDENERLRAQLGMAGREPGAAAAAAAGSMGCNVSSSGRPAAPAPYAQKRSFPMHDSADDLREGSHELSGAFSELADGFELAPY